MFLDKENDAPIEKNKTKKKQNLSNKKPTKVKKVSKK